MNLLKKGEGGPTFKLRRGSWGPTLKFERGPGVPLLIFRRVLGVLVPLLILRGVPRSEVPLPGVLVPLLHHATADDVTINTLDALIIELIEKN